MENANIQQVQIPQNELTENFMTEDEMCAFLGVKKTQLDYLRRHAKMPFIKITNQRRLYPVKELSDWMRNGRLKVLNSGA